ncbi:MAG: TIGR00288 family NYN domain-containing protein [Candidatus Micrarchaeota archaeon]|nr:TIGR00288 family NYN domain-containing protein [Candidatus Micrarchaeota archaeon]
MAVIDKLRSLVRPKEEKNIALLVDGPNVIRKDVNVDLEGVKKKVEKYGKIKICKVFLDQYASDKLIEAVTNQGYEPVITTGDVDVTMAVYAVEQVFNPNIQIIALMTRDIDFRPVIVKAKEKGKETIVIGADPGFSVALKKTADIVIFADTR